MVGFDALYALIKDIGVRDIFMSEGLMSGTVSTPTELLFDSEKERITRFFADNLSIDYESTSDYERFSLLVSNFDNVSGSAVAQRLRIELDLLFGYDGAINEAHTERIWKLCSDAIAEAGYERSRLFSRVSLANSSEAKGLFRLTLGGFYARSYLDYVSELCTRFLMSGKTTLFCDVSQVAFVRSDVYHCEEAYKAAATQRGYTKHLEDTLVCGVIYSLCETAKREGKELILNVGRNLDSASGLLNYLIQRGVLPRTRILVSQPYLKTAARELCGVFGKSVVSFGIAYESGDTEYDIANKFREAASVYPLSKIDYLGVLPRIALPEAAHLIVKRGLSRYLSEICECEDAAQRLAYSIFEGK